MIVRLLIYAAVFGLTALASSHFKITYRFEDYKIALDILLAASGMVFTIMGIWIAFLYPNALKRITDTRTVLVADFTDTLVETRRLEAIVASILKSGAVVISVLLIALTKVFFHQSELYCRHAHELKHLALASLVTLAYMQLEAVFSVAYANVMFLNDLHRRREERQADESL